MKCKGKNYVFIRYVPRGDVNIPVVVIFGMSYVFNIFHYRKDKLAVMERIVFFPDRAFTTVF